MQRQLNLAYAAGLVDGEGCLSINRCNQQFQPRIAVSMTNPTGLELLVSLFGGNILEPKHKVIRKQLYEWKLHNSKAINAILELIPYLKVKLPQAAVLLKGEWFAFKGKPLTDKEKQVRLEIYTRLKELNKRGV